MTRSFKSILTICLITSSIFLMTGCTKVPKDHPINDAWEYVHYKHADGYIETYGADTTIVIEIASSNQLAGIGPQESFEGSAEIWKDGAIQIGDLCCANITAGDSTFWPQVQLFNRLTSSARYEVFSNTLVLKNTTDGTEIQFVKQ